MLDLVSCYSQSFTIDLPFVPRKMHCGETMPCMPTSGRGNQTESPILQHVCEVYKAEMIASIHLDTTPCQIKH